MDALTASLAVVGTIGVTTIFDLIRRSQRWTKAQRLLRFRYREPIDIVVNTAIAAGSRPVHVVDNEVLFGNVQSASLFSSTIGAARRQKRIQLHLSEHLTSRLQHDLILVGGITRSEVGRKYLRLLDEHIGAGVAVFEEDDETRNRIVLGDFEVVYDWTKAHAAGQVDVDYALVVVWINPFIDVPRRSIFCTGFTSFGTAVAAEYLMTTFIQTAKVRPLRGYQLRPSRKLMHLGPYEGSRLHRWLSRPWPAFAFAIRVDATNGQAVSTTIVKIVHLSTARCASGL